MAVEWWNVLVFAFILFPGLQWNPNTVDTMPTVSWRKFAWLSCHLRALCLFTAAVKPSIFQQHQGCQNALWIACGRWPFKKPGFYRLTGRVLQVIFETGRLTEDWPLLEDWTTWSDCSVSCGIGAITRFVIRYGLFASSECGLLNTSWFGLNVFGRMCYCYVVRKMIVQCTFCIVFQSFYCVTYTYYTL